MPRRAISNGRQPTIDSPRKTTSPDGERERAGDQVEHRALAGAVRADQAEDLAGLDRERQVVDGDQAAELLARRPHVEQRPARGACVARAGSGSASGTGGGARCGSRRAIHGHTPSRARCSSTTISMPNTTISKLPLLAEQRRQEVLQHLLRAA